MLRNDDAFNNYLAMWISLQLMSHDHVHIPIDPSKPACTNCYVHCRCMCLCLLPHHHRLLLLLLLLCCWSTLHLSVHPFSAFICHCVHSLVKKCINLALSHSLSLFCYKSCMNKVLHQGHHLWFLYVSMAPTSGLSVAVY